MKILITGSNGILGRIIGKELEMLGHEISTLGRVDADFPWTLGVYPAPEVMRNFDACIHFAWSTNDRMNDSHINVGGTWRLAEIARITNVSFLFISTVAVGSNSHYGMSKHKAEGLVLLECGFVIRFGLLTSANVYETKFSKYIYPKSNLPIKLTHVDDMKESINSWLKSIGTSGEVVQIRDVVSTETTLSQYFRSQGFLIGIPINLIYAILKFGSFFSLRCRNYLDSILSIKGDRNGHK
jgi:nucleoside-diphosphate-sugar epimerase